MNGAPLFTRRRLVVLLTDLVIFFLAYAGAHLIRVDLAGESQRWATASTHFERTILAVVLAKALVFILAGTYRGLLQYATITDMVLMARNSVLASLASLFVIAFFQDFRVYSRGVILIDWMLTAGLVASSRVVWRMIREGAFDLSRSWRTDKHVLIVGAGRAGVALAKDFRATFRHAVEIVGFVDDDPEKQNCTVLGRPVLGGIKDLPQILKEREVDQVVVAIPSATPRDVQRIARLAAGAREFRIIPSLAAVLSGKVPIGQTLPVPLETFLSREAVDLANAELVRFCAGKTVMVTGAGGSIGGELARQLAREGESVARLILVDAAETPLYHIHQAASATLGERAVAVLASIRDTARMEHLLRECRPEVVLHAAAIKHVPLSESHPLEAIATNTLASCRLADKAIEAGVEHFVLVSTDKAVAPASVMGASKRAAEVYIQSLARSSRTRFVAVRFGNVLGSNGSVVPLFHEQIARGGPVTVTDPRATRFFMTIPEACGLILHATRIAQGGEVYVLEMGEPVRILDLAHNLIRLYGYEPGKDIEVRLIGLRPGEKLHESLLDDGELAQPSIHPRILRVLPNGSQPQRPADLLSRLEAAVLAQDVPASLRVLQDLVPTYVSLSSNAHAGTTR